MSEERDDSSSRPSTERPDDGPASAEHAAGARPDEESDSPSTRATVPAPPVDPMLGRLIDGRYLLLEVIGQGGMGAVYRASHVLMDKPVAVKLIHSELAHLPEVARRFEREARSSSRLTDPHCITVTDFGRTEDGILFLVMELLDGESLADRLARSGALPVSLAVDIAIQVLKGLAHAHAAGVVHRDLKPENVMLVVHGDQPDFAKILDFGIAKLATVGDGGEKLTQAGLVFGTPQYLSPEQAAGDAVDHRADLYAVGAMLFEMLTSRVPYDADSAVQIISLHVTAPIPRLSDFGAFPPGLQPVIDRALAKRPDDRFATAEEFISALQTVDLGTDAGTKAEQPPDPRLLARAAWAATRTAAVRLWTVARERVARSTERERRMVGRIAGTLLLLLAVVSILSKGGESEDRSAPPAPLPLVPAASGDEDDIEAMIAKADSQIRSGLPAEAVITTKEILRLSPDHPAALLLLGHARFLLGEKAEAMESYEKALRLDGRLASDVRLGEHLREGLKWPVSQSIAGLLMARYGGNEDIAHLVTRANSAQSPLTERRAAREALVQTGRGRLVDWLSSLTADFLQTNDCEERKEIIARIEKTGDPRFLPLLEEHRPVVKKSGLFKKTTVNACIGPAVLKAIDTLQAAKTGRPVSGSDA